MHWDEATMLARVLCQDSSSRTFASVNSWSYPVTLEWMALKALIDRYTSVHGKRPYQFLPAPWDDEPTRWGKPMSLSDYRAAVRQHRAAGPSQERAEIRGG